MPLPDDSPCSDDDACTRRDACQGGVCVGTEPVLCTARDQCHRAGTCDPITGTCSDPVLPDDAPCSDADACTRTDACQGGVCIGSDPVACSALDQCHRVGTCDPATGTCSDPALPDDSSCSDADACTRTDTCQAGRCTGSDPVVCTARDQCHRVGTCDRTTGLCSDPQQPDGALCSDTNVCTTDDVCQSGACVGTRLDGCCLAAEECDDGFACTDDRCADRACLHVAIDTRCGPAEECADAVCAPEEPGVGPSGCVQRPVSEARFCMEDADPCTMDACSDGACVHDRTGAETRCGRLAKALRSALALLQRASDLRNVVDTAASVECPQVGPTIDCDIVTGPDGPAPRLLALLGSARTDVEAAARALGGRLGAPTAPGTPRGSARRARLALVLIGETPQTIRGVLETLARGKARDQVAPAFARARRAEARILRRDTARLRATLRRLLVQQASFAR